MNILRKCQKNEGTFFPSSRSFVILILFGLFLSIACSEQNEIKKLRGLDKLGQVSSTVFSHDSTIVSRDSVMTLLKFKVGGVNNLFVFINIHGHKNKQFEKQVLDSLESFLGILIPQLTLVDEPSQSESSLLFEVTSANTDNGLHSNYIQFTLWRNVTINETGLVGPVQTLDRKLPFTEQNMRSDNFWRILRSLSSDFANIWFLANKQL